MHEWKYDVVKYETAKAREIVDEEITDLANALEESGNKEAALDLLCDYHCFIIAWRDAVTALRNSTPRLTDRRHAATENAKPKTF